jgi:hypothetical protein
LHARSSWTACTPSWPGRARPTQGLAPAHQPPTPKPDSYEVTSYFAFQP